MQKKRCSTYLSKINEYCGDKYLPWCEHYTMHTHLEIANGTSRICTAFEWIANFKSLPYILIQFSLEIPIKINFII